MQTILNHGVCYNFKINSKKVESIPKLNNFYNFCKSVFTSCPDHYFLNGPRSSVLKFSIESNPIKINGHEISKFAKLALDHFKASNFSNHEKVQNFLMLYDKKTIAMELPLWVEDNEPLPLVKGNLTGHVDILRYENNKIWIWDYKPNAVKEKHATTQVYYYALMLSKRCNLNLDDIRCGYFDDKDTFVFSPKKVKINSEISKYNKSFK